MFLGKTQDGPRTRPWNKNRHTKPCKFYQTMSCPLSADVCDFAHVLVDPTPPISVDAAACPHYQAGYCANGAWCRYAHSIQASPALSGTMNGVRVSSRDGPRPRSISYTGPRTCASTNRGVISMHAPVPANAARVPPPTPAHLSSPPPSNSFPSLSHHSATMTSSDLIDDAYACTEDPQMSEHSHSHQSRIHIADPSPLVHVAPYPNPVAISPISPPYHQFPPQLYMLEPKFFHFPPPPAKKHKTRGISKKKLERYKTKPCKFFLSTGMCPNGDSCTFIHDEDPQAITRVSLSKNRAEVADDEASDDSSESANFSSLLSDQTNGRRVGSPFHYGSSSDNDWSESDNPTLKKTKYRTRANSIPSRPSASGQLNVDNLFPAESPAVL